MALGARKSKSKPSLSNERRQAAIEAIAGITEAAYLAAMTDGELNEDELEIIARIVSGLCGEQADAEQILAIIEACDQAFDSEGFEARMEAIAHKLPNNEARAAALYAAACVILGDEEFDAENEGSFYDDLSTQLGAPEEVSVEIWNDVAANYGWA